MHCYRCIGGLIVRFKSEDIFRKDMKCEICKKESPWLEIVGKNFCCYKCINKNKFIGLVLRTHADTFKHIMKKLDVKDYDHMIKLTKDEVAKVADLKKYNII